MLAGENDGRRNAAFGQSGGDWRQLDCFRTCADDYCNAEIDLTVQQFPQLRMLAGEDDGWRDTARG